MDWGSSCVFYLVTVKEKERKMDGYDIIFDRGNNIRV
jgi:hypothetical protein